MVNLKDKAATFAVVFFTMVVCGAILMALIAPYIVMAYGAIGVLKVAAWIVGVSVVLAIPAWFID